MYKYYIYKRKQHTKVFHVFQIFTTKSKMVRVIKYIGGSTWVRVMMFNVTFNNISAISWRSALLVEETGVPGENHRPVASH